MVVNFITVRWTQQPGPSQPLNPITTVIITWYFSRYSGIFFIFFGNARTLIQYFQINMQQLCMESKTIIFWWITKILTLFFLNVTNVHSISLVWSSFCLLTKFWVTHLFKEHYYHVFWQYLSEKKLKNILVTYKCSSFWYIKFEHEGQEIDLCVGSMLVTNTKILLIYGISKLSLQEGKT